MNFKRIIAGILSLTIVGGAVMQLGSAGELMTQSVISANAEEFTSDVYDETLTYMKFYNCVEIRKCAATAESVSIPAEIDGLPVTKIWDNAFRNCSKLTDVTLPDTIKFIGDDAFYGCTSLEELIIPDSVEYIGVYLANGCTSLKKAKLPKNIKFLGSDTFNKCENLTEVTLPENITTLVENMFYQCKSLENITIPDTVTTIEHQAFIDCKSLKEIVIPDSVKNVSTGVFCGCYELEKVTLPKAPESFGGTCFLGSKWETNYFQDHDYLIINDMLVDAKYGLTEAVIPDGVKVIADSAFSNDKIASVVIPDSCTRIGDHAFYYCSKLTDVTLPESVEYIGKFAFSNTKWWDQFFNEDIVIINNVLISAVNCPGDFKIPEGVNYVLPGAVTYASDVTEIIVPEDITSTEYMSSIGKNVKSIVFPDSLETVSRISLSGKYINKVKFNEGLKNIEYSAFADVIYLKELTLPQTLENIGESAFTGSCCEEIVVPRSVKYVGKKAFCKARYLKYITFENPDCEIFDDAMTISSTLSSIGFKGVIRGYKGSTAEAYARKYNFTFEALDGSPAESLYGDVNCDGEVNIADIVVLQKWLLGSYSKSISTENADLCSDGVIDTYDLVMLRKLFIEKKLAPSVQIFPGLYSGMDYDEAKEIIENDYVCKSESDTISYYFMDDVSQIDVDKVAMIALNGKDGKLVSYTVNIGHDVAENIYTGYSKKDMADEFANIVKFFGKFGTPKKPDQNTAVWTGTAIGDITIKNNYTETSDDNTSITITVSGKA